jgi:hypothetical protein
MQRHAITPRSHHGYQSVSIGFSAPVEIVAAFTLLALTTVFPASAGAQEVSEVEVLSARFRATVMPDGVDGICSGAESAVGLAGMPFVLDRRVVTLGDPSRDPDALDPSLFLVEVSAGGRKVVPLCATLNVPNSSEAVPVFITRVDSALRSDP